MSEKLYIFAAETQGTANAYIYAESIEEAEIRMSLGDYDESDSEEMQVVNGTFKRCITNE